MFRLTREVRFAINDAPDAQLSHGPANSYAGYPSLTGAGKFLRVQVTLEGPLDPQTSYLRNIREIDQVVRDRIIATGQSVAPQSVFATLRKHFGDSLSAVWVSLSPFLSIGQLGSEYDMQTRLSQKFEFSAAHRLHNPSVSDEENRSLYGKCNYPNGHGHNYELQVTLRGRPAESGMIVDLPTVERLVKKHVLDRFDHQNLNLDVEEFKTLVPTVENIAMVIYRLLKSPLKSDHAELAAVTVWETPKTWCEYSE